MDSSQKRVLVVDDVGFVRRRLQRTLTKNGFVVELADSGNSAIKIIEKNHTIMAVLTDLHMPFMNGIDLFKAVSRIERVGDDGAVPPPAFILLTETGIDIEHSGNESGFLIKHAIDLGFVDVLRKPVDEQRLTGLLNALAENSPTAQCPAEKPDPFNIPQQTIKESLLQIRKMVGDLIGIADIDALLQMHDGLTANLGRIDASLKMFEVEPMEPEPDDVESDETDAMEAAEVESSEPEPVEV